MLAEIKRDFRLLKYIPQFKMNIIMSVVVFLMGIPMMILAKEDMVQVGVMYLLLGATLIQSNLYTLLRVSMVSSSHRRRSLDGVAANLILIVGSVLAYVLLSIRMAIGMKISGTDYRPAMIVAIMIMVIEIIYCSIAYKGWLVSSIVFFIVVMWLMMSSPQELIKTLPEVGIGVIIVIGAVVILLANVAACLIRKALYRRAMTFGKNLDMQKRLK